MTKPNRLEDALKAKAQGSPPAPPPASRPRPVTRGKATSRAGKVMISAYFAPEVRASFRLIQARHPDRQMQHLLAEAFNDLFAKYNVPQAAKVD